MRNAWWNHILSIPELVEFLPDGETNLEWGDVDRVEMKNGIVYKMLTDTGIVNSERGSQLWRFFLLNTSKTKSHEMGETLTKKTKDFSGPDQGSFGGKKIRFIEQSHNQDPEWWGDLETYVKIQDYIVHI